MTMLLDSVGPTGSAPNAPSRASRRRRLGIALVVVAALVGTGRYVAAHRAPTPEAFVAFAQQLDSYGPPSGPAGVAWTRLDPTQPGYNGTPGSDWVGGESSGTWTSTSDPSSWVAVHGWNARVPVADVAATCDAVGIWLTGTAAGLGVSTSGSSATVADCRSAVATVRAEDGNVDDAWASVGLQHGDGTMRYRLGSIIATAQDDPDHVTITVMADATRYAG